MRTWTTAKGADLFIAYSPRQHALRSLDLARVDYQVAQEYISTSSAGTSIQKSVLWQTAMRVG
jgi:hypothetical protein